MGVVHRGIIQAFYCRLKIVETSMEEGRSYKPLLGKR